MDSVRGDDRGVSVHGRGWCSGDERCGCLDDGGGGHGGGDVGSCCNERALHGYFVGVGVAGGDRKGVSDRDRGSGDHGCGVDGWCQEAWCWFRRWSGQGAGEQGEQSDEFVHGCCSRFYSTKKAAREFVL